MILSKKTILGFSIVAALTGCADDETAHIKAETHNAPVKEGVTLTNTSDLITIGAATEKNTVTITLGATSDLHGRLFGRDYAILKNGEPKVDDDAGLTRIATLIDENLDENSILIDIGDTVQGNSAQLFNDQPTHPMVEALNHLNYDVWVPGNHEFNFERSFIDRNLASFNGAVISSNIQWESNGANYIKSFQMFDVKGVRVAIIGVSPSYIPNWEASAPEHFAGLTFGNELDSVRTAINEMLVDNKPDVVIGALHLGRTDAGQGVYKIASELADQFDIIFAGHEHATYIESVTKGAKTGASIAKKDGKNYVEDETLTLAGKYDESNRTTMVKIIEPGKWGAALAKAEVQLAKNANGEWELVDTALSNISTKKVAENQALQNAFLEVDNTSATDAKTEIGSVTGNLINPNSTKLADEATGEAFDGNAARLYSTIHKAKVVDTPMIDFINQIQLNKADANVSAASLFSDMSSLTDGETYTKAKSANLYMYDNTLMGVYMTGANLKKYMEWSYSYFNEYKPGDLTYSFNKNIRPYNYDQFDGSNFKYTVDLTGAAYGHVKKEDGTFTVTNPGSRIQISEIAGETFDEAKVYKVAINNYRFGSHIVKFGWATKDDVYYESTNEEIYAIRDMLTDYVKTHKGVDVNNFKDNLDTWSIKQDADIAAARTDGAHGQKLWNKLQNKEVCVQINWESSRYRHIAISLNPDNADSYFKNADGTTGFCNIQPSKR